MPISSFDKKFVITNYKLIQIIKEGLEMVKSSDKKDTSKTMDKLERGKKLLDKYKGELK